MKRGGTAGKAKWFKWWVSTRMAGGNQFFSLARFRIQCCSADAIRLNVPIFSAEPITNFEVSQWVQVTAGANSASRAFVGKPFSWSIAKVR